jgi:tetratricopeptide (TPR) repeat protein
MILNRRPPFSVPSSIPYRNMKKPDLWTRLKEARIVQVLVVYLGASWGILQVVDILQGSLSLPDWVSPVSLILLLIGLVIILATAWVQSLPSTTRKEEAGEVPGDWEVAPKEVLTSLASGELPHLTWGRSILGGVMALLVMFGLAGIAVVFKGPLISLGPSEAGAGVAPAGIAVVPFGVTGEGLDLWREGMVDVISTNLDGMGGYRTIDSRTVMARWRERVGDGSDPDLRTSLEVAGSTGARFGLVGSLVGSPAGVRVMADLYDLDSGEKVVQSWVEGSEEEVLELVGELSVDLTRKLLEATGGDVIQAPRTASLTTHSLPALRAFLEGETAYRHSDFAGAVSGFERAVGIDSTFALGWQRLAASYQWLENMNSEQGRIAVERAWELRDRLPVRDRILVRADKAMVDADLRIITDLRDAARNYPDDPEVWYLLGDFYLHFGLEAGMADHQDILEAFERAVSLDPEFTPYHIHLIELYITHADTAKALEAMEKYERLSPGDLQARPYLRLAHDLFLSTAEERDAVLASLDEKSENTIADVGIMMQWGPYPDKDWVVTVARRAFERTGHGLWFRTLGNTLLNKGDLAALTEHYMAPGVPPVFPAGGAVTLSLLGLPIPDELIGMVNNPELCPEREDPGTWCLYVTGFMAAKNGNSSRFAELVDVNRSLARTLAASDPGQQSHADFHDALAENLEGTWEVYQGGDLNMARRKLREVLPEFSDDMAVFTRWILAEALEEGRPQEALSILENMGGWVEGYAQVRVGRIREGMGDTRVAAEAYRNASQIFADGDPSNPYLVEAREAVERLTQ